LADPSNTKQPAMQRMLEVLYLFDAALRME
jgi:hypothetical protein